LVLVHQMTFRRNLGLPKPPSDQGAFLNLLDGDIGDNRDMLVPAAFFLSQIIPSRSSNYSSQLSDFDPIFVHESITFDL